MAFRLGRIGMGLTALLIFPYASLGATTGSVGSGTPFDNFMPSLGMEYLVKIAGPVGDLGEVALFAEERNRPNGWVSAEGQLLPVAGNEDLFGLLGSTYGGNGTTEFALPDLRGRAVIGAGQGSGLPNYTLGQQVGAEQVTLATLPGHAHPLGSGLTTESSGGISQHSNLQPSLALTPIIATTGIFPSRSLTQPAGDEGQPIAEIGTDGADPILSEVAWLAHDTVPEGWTVADGRVLQIRDNEALFSLLGDRYGGDGRNDFALPDLRGRAAVAASGFGDLGESIGAANEGLSIDQIPAHTHDLPGGGQTDSAGGSVAQRNTQPTLALTHAVALAGLYPSAPFALATAEGDTPPIAELGHGNEPYLGSVTMFAAGFAPRGYTDAHGQLLPIAQNTALFSLLGTDFGGDGRSTFALPDLRDRIAVGTGSGVGLTPRLMGEEFGAAQSVLTEANLPAHTHEFSIPGDFNDDGRVDSGRLQRRRPSRCRRLHRLA